MPRFAVSFADPSDATTSIQLLNAYNASFAICLHPWINDVYQARWIEQCLWEDEEEELIANIHTRLGYLVCVLNLDTAIMKDLNAGDSSASSSQQQM